MTQKPKIKKAEDPKINIGIITIYFIITILMTIGLHLSN